jgi:hypothetical protein
VLIGVVVERLEVAEIGLVYCSFLQNADEGQTIDIIIAVRKKFLFLIATPPEPDRPESIWYLVSGI